jgi:hypothetical protein
MYGRQGKAVTGFGQGFFEIERHQSTGDICNVRGRKLPEEQFIMPRFWKLRL